MIVERTKAIQKVRVGFKKKYGEECIWYLGEKTKIDIPRITTGSASLDRATGGGYPKGRSIEIYGNESSGKTTLALSAIAEVQRQGGIAAFIDVEQSFDPRYAKVLGVDLDNLIISQPENGEQALEITEALVRSGAIDLLVFDSVGAIVTEIEMSGDMGQYQVGRNAKLMGQALRKLTPIIAKTECTVIFINQVREKVGVLFGNPEVTTGGRALKFAASIRLEVRRTGVKKEGDKVTASRVRVRVVKNKVAPPLKVAEFDIVYGGGVCKMGDLLDTASDMKIVKQSGSWYSFDNNSLGHGRAKAIKHLEENPEVAQMIKLKVMTEIENECSISNIDEYEETRVLHNIDTEKYEEFEKKEEKIIEEKEKKEEVKEEIYEELKDDEITKEVEIEDLEINKKVEDCDKLEDLDIEKIETNIDETSEEKIIEEKEVPKEVDKIEKVDKVEEVIEVNEKENKLDEPKENTPNDSMMSLLDMLRAHTSIPEENTKKTSYKSSKGKKK